MRIRPALNTVTFRQLSPEDLISACKDEGILALEWAGDAHAPPGDPDRAAGISRLCAEQGVAVASYASYYQCDEGGPGGGPFAWNLGPEKALETARALEAPAVRVWAGRQASDAASHAYRDTVAGCLREFCGEAEKSGIQVHLEYHRNTLTDTPLSTVTLLEAVGSGNLSTYWQPRLGLDEAACLADLRMIAPWLSHLHVFHWDHDGGAGPPIRLPLDLGRDRWEQYLAFAGSLPGDRYAMMEFVRGDTREQFKADARTLRDLIASSARRPPQGL
jgi:sugar phosphate isomerase/epimerase